MAEQPTPSDDATRESKQLLLIPMPPTPPVEPELRKPRHPVWTENKALLIQRYLYYFVMITKHGTYIDGFAGPQDPNNEDTWAAKLVIESRPRWLRQLFLCEIDGTKVELLGDLVARQPPRDKEKSEPKRTVEVLPGDCNQVIPALLASGKLNPNDATFCLLDQRTFECEWATVQAVAAHRAEGYKVEQFYFLANSWLERAIAATTTEDGVAAIRRWWGCDDWGRLREMDSMGRAQWLCARFRDELGYTSVKAWPIFEHRNGGKIMYFMIHATDHPEAPKLMSRAYLRAVMPVEPMEQLSLDDLLRTEVPPDDVLADPDVPISG
jgi:three-Cys-motif partner protein